MAYYALYLAYSDAISEYDTLMRFETKEERAEMVERINDTHEAIHPHAFEVTTREVRHRFPIQRFCNDPWHEYWDEVQDLRTCAGRSFFECKQYRDYIL